MPRIAPVVPAETSLLCEKCGYVLDGLPQTGECPECGRPIVDSIGVAGPHARRTPLWEHTDRPATFARFLSTTASAVFRPTAFFRHFATRPDDAARRRGRVFGLVHSTLTALLVGSAAFFHAYWFVGISWLYTRGSWGPPAWFTWLLLATLAVFCIVCFALLALTTRVAARLTAWEAAYRGLRLPLPVVLRGLQYHAAHYLPVGLMFLLTVVGFRAFQERIEAQFPAAPYRALIGYHFVLGGEVIVAAYYLFRTYWIAMRSMMYANR